MVDVIVTGEFEAWYGDLDEGDTDAVYRAVELLVARGVALGHPHSSAIKGSSHALRELRVQSGGDAIRVFYAFDPKRQAVLLVGGHKRSDRFYDEYVPRAERIWEDYLSESKETKP